MESIDLTHLLDKYYKGETSEAEEKEIKQYFNDVSELPSDLKPEQLLFKAYTSQQQIGLDKFLADDWLFEKIKVADQHSGGRRVILLKQLMKIAASLILVAGAFWIGLWYKQSDSQPRPEGANLGQELQDMRQVLLASQSPSDRITILSQDFDPLKDKQVIDILIETLNQDANVNVRLAACAALYKFKNDDKARKGFIQSLQRQTDPMIQIVLIEILSEIKERESLEELKRFQEKENLLPAVRKKAEQGLTILLEA